MDCEEKAARVIVLAVDGSETAHHAWTYFKEFLHRKSDRLHFLFCDNDPNLGIIDWEKTIKDSVEKCEALKDKYLAECQHLGINRTECFHFERYPYNDVNVAHTIEKYADTHKADMIIIGSRGLGFTKGVLLGSVSQKLLTFSKKPVLVVPPRLE
ncbi:hypothetical protein Ciccas_005109 [Cichlidogyrus casuarinus]|uniref:UspA domain-containing protein n=1 Tax=Cichlidogyrus casuarinus TaxID=1844966 RepID=A0ABD2Q9K7_9PLAT